MRKSRLGRNLITEASLAFDRSNVILYENQNAQIERASALWGDVAVVEDFKKWSLTADKSSRYPLNDYLRVIDARLSATPPKESPTSAAMMVVDL